MHKLYENYKVLQLIALQAITTETATKGSAVDCKGLANDIVATLQTGAMTGTHTCIVKMQESATTTDGDFVDITGAVFTTLDANSDSKIASIGFKRTKRYIRAVATTAGTVTANDIAVSAMARSEQGKSDLNSATVA